MSSTSYRWAKPGDVNAFFGLMLDNIADLSMTVGLLHSVFEFPTDFCLRRLVPGTAAGVLVGDLLFFWLALKLAKRTGRGDVTAMPLGLDTPSTFGMVLFVLGPAFVDAKQRLGLDVDAAAHYAWHVGIWSILISGVLKLACAAGSGWIRRVVPRAGLLGSLTAIALVLISFLPLVELLHEPVVGLASLAVILTTLVARVSLPLRIPGALGAVLIGGSMYYLLQSQGWLATAHPASAAPEVVLLPLEWLDVFRGAWIGEFRAALAYLPVVVPFALGTVVGGIDCTESAAAAGDEYDTRQVIGVEAVATIVAALCGGVIQTTPYIGQPAYKALGGRAAYVLATALFVGAAGLVGFFGYLYVLIPKPTVLPILVFVGLEITAQSFRATPHRHYPAVALACVPALAALAAIYIDKVIGALTPPGTTAVLPESLRLEVDTVRMLSSGFVLTSLLWGSWLAAIVDRRLRLAAVYMTIAAGFTCCGLMHSPLPGSALFLPWELDAELRRAPLSFTAGYLGTAILTAAWSCWPGAAGRRPSPADPLDDSPEDPLEERSTTDAAAQVERPGSSRREHGPPAGFDKDSYG